MDDLLQQVGRNLEAAEPVVEDDATPSHGTMDGLKEKDDSDEKEEEGGNVLRALYLAEHEGDEDVQRLLGELSGGTRKKRMRPLEGRCERTAEATAMKTLPWRPTKKPKREWPL